MDNAYLTTTSPLETLLSAFHTQHRESLWDLQQQHKLLLVFLRSFNCPFCQSRCKRLSKAHNTLTQLGYKIVFVHQHYAADAEPFFNTFGSKIANCPRVSDVALILYKHFELNRGTLKNVFNLGVAGKGFQLAITGNIKSFATQNKGDMYQMPGFVTLHQGHVLTQFKLQNTSEQVDMFEILPEFAECYKQLHKQDSRFFDHTIPRADLDNDHAPELSPAASVGPARGSLTQDLSPQPALACMAEGNLVCQTSCASVRTSNSHLSGRYSGGFQGTDSNNYVHLRWSESGSAIAIAEETGSGLGSQHNSLRSQTTEEILFTEKRKKTYSCFGASSLQDRSQLTLVAVMTEPKFYKAFKLYATKEYCVENLLFLEDLKQFLHMKDGSPAKTRKAEEMAVKYIDPNGSHAVNINIAAVTDVTSQMKEMVITNDLFSLAAKQIVANLYDIFYRFCSSDLCKALCK